MSLELASRSEMDELYIELAPQLRRILGTHLQVPECVVEDACQVAWTTLLSGAVELDRPRVLSWLATTARREALTMLKRAEIERRVLEQAPLRAVSEPQAAAVEFWEHLGQVRRLSRRQQRMVWMHGMGFQYDEIAARTGATSRTVERQLTLARQKLGSAA